MGEFSQCLGQLHSLWAGGVAGSELEFAAYEVLHHAATGSASADAPVSLASLTPAARAHAWVQHALAVRAALSVDNWARFFKLRK